MPVDDLALPQGFQQYYSEVFGSRWEPLLEALLQPEEQVVRWNAFSSAPPPEDSPEISWLNSCFWRSDLKNHEPHRDELGLLDSYIMDPASVLAAKALPLNEGDKVLDMCAAPGGKSLILMEGLADSESQLIVNEPSPPRRERLKKVIRQYVPDHLRSQLSVKGVDGVKFGRDKHSFDAILLDAPCSGERHLLQNKSELGSWTISRTKGLSKKQGSLLGSAFSALKPGGHILYSTCSISPLENDGVVTRLLKKKSGELEVISLAESTGYGEPTEHGLWYLPDRSKFGPLYFSLLRKSL